MTNSDNVQSVPISKKVLNLVKRSKKVFGNPDWSQISEQDLLELNNRMIPDTLAVRRLLKKPARNIDINSFIIPVEGGVITAYHYEKSTSSTQSMTSLRPMIIFYHGGGWVWGNMDLYSYICTRIASITGAVVLSVDYRLAPQHKFPTAVEDCYQSLLWAAQGSRYWKIDPEAIFVMGDSAGGNLAAVVARLARDRKGPQIAGQILIYPITDGRLRTPSFDTFKESPTLTAKEMQFYVTNYRSEPKDILNPNFSPLLSKDHSRLPPALIITADNDPLLDDGRLYAEALESADVPVRYLECKGTVHRFYNYPDAPGSKETDGAIMQFVGGKSLETIELLTVKELKKLQRAELKAEKSRIGVEIG